jgi:hypothetical protein
MTKHGNFIVFGKTRRAYNSQFFKCVRQNNHGNLIIEFSNGHEMIADGEDNFDDFLALFDNDSPGSKRADSTSKRLKKNRNPYDLAVIDYSSILGNELLTMSELIDRISVKYEQYRGIDASGRGKLEKRIRNAVDNGHLKSKRFARYGMRSIFYSLYRGEPSLNDVYNYRAYGFAELGTRESGVELWRALVGKDRNRQEILTLLIKHYPQKYSTFYEAEKALEAAIIVGIVARNEETGAYFIKP